MKAWIVTKDRRACLTYKCPGFTKPNSKTKVHDDGTIDVTCRHCGGKRQEKADSYQDKRACIECHHVRKVIVHLNQSGEEYGSEKYCTACQLRRSANRHLYMAQKLIKQAKEIEAKRQISSIEKRSPTSVGDE